MGKELFEKIILDAKNLGTVEYITHGGMGEPLLDKSIADRICFEKTHLGSTIQLHTNGSYLDGDAFKRLAEAGLDVLSISLNAFYSQTHKTVTQLDYDTVKRNVFTAFDLKKKHSLPINMRITLVRGDSVSIKEVNEFKSFWQELTPHVAVHQMKNWAGFSGARVTGCTMPCKWIWHMLSVKWDGTASICHEDYDSKEIIGDLNDSDILEVFNSPKIKQLRGVASKNQQESVEFCEGCSMLNLSYGFWKDVKVINLADNAVKYSQKR
jgi:radical SAM protein with 4Fe4S-binding SPASM domain